MSNQLIENMKQNKFFAFHISVYFSLQVASSQTRAAGLHYPQPKRTSVPFDSKVNVSCDDVYSDCENEPYN